MSIIKNAKRSLFTTDLKQWGYEFDFKVNMDSKTGDMFTNIPEHYIETFKTHNIKENEEFNRYFKFIMRKGTDVIYFKDKDISTFEDKILKLNTFYYELRKSECEKKVIVIDAKLAHNFIHSEHDDYSSRETINDFTFNETTATTSSIIHFGYRVGYKIGINIYSRPDWQGVQPSPLLCNLDDYDAREIKVIDWTQEREDFLQMIYFGMEKLILQLEQFKESITEQTLLEKIDKKQIGNLNSLLLENKGN